MYIDIGSRYIYKKYMIWYLFEIRDAVYLRKTWKHT